MTLRSDLGRYTSFPREQGALAETLGEFARDANLALNRRVLGFSKRVLDYIATGSTATLIPLTQTKAPPYGVILVRAEQVTDPSAVVAATTSLNFNFANGSLNVPEPSGLTADTRYNLTFLVLEA